MASKSSNHARSSSFPCETHPLVASVKEKLSEFNTTDSVLQKLGGLKNLHERVEDLLQLSLTKNEENIVNEMLEGSVLLLDLCSSSKDVFSQMKEAIKELESSLRRKKNSGFNIENEVGTYMMCKKRLNKVISENVRVIEKNTKAVKVSGLVSYVRTMKEVEKTSLMVFESLLCYVSQTKTRTLKMFKPRQELQTQMEKMEAELNLVSKQITVEKIENLLEGLKVFESKFQKIEEELESVYRQLLKNRVTLLNLLNLSLVYMI